MKKTQAEYEKSYQDRVTEIIKPWLAKEIVNKTRPEAILFVRAKTNLTFKEAIEFVDNTKIDK